MITAQKSQSELEARLRVLANDRQRISKKLREDAVFSSIDENNHQSNGLPTATDPQVENRMKAEQLVRLRKILQEGISIKNHLFKSKNIKDIEPWEQALAELTEAQHQEANAHDSIEKPRILDDILRDCLKYEAMSAVIFQPDTDYLSSFAADIDQIASDLAEQSTTKKVNDTEQVKDVQEILAKRRVEAAKNSTSDAPEDNKKNRRMSVNPITQNLIQQSESEAQAKLEKLINEKKQIEAIRQAEATKLRQQLIRRKTKIKQKLETEQETANALIEENRKAKKRDATSKERQKTLILERTKTLIRERTMVAPNQEDSGPKFKEMDPEVAAKKAEELQQRMQKTVEKNETELVEAIDEKGDEAKKKRVKRTEADLQNKLKKRTKTFVQEQAKNREEYETDSN